MTDMLTEYIDDPETVLIAWLQPLRRTANIRRAGDPLPFTLVTHVAGEEDVDLSWADPVLSVHTLCDKALGEVAARDEANETHRRILLLARDLPQVDLAGGRKATIDYMKVFQMPRWEPYGDEQILRKVGRYQIGLSYAEIP